MSRSKARRRGEQPIWKGSFGKNNDNHQAHKSDNGGIQQRWNPIWHKEQLKTMHKMVRDFLMWNFIKKTPSIISI
jgi:hypothetical protein